MKSLKLLALTGLGAGALFVGAPPSQADEGFRCETGRLVARGDHMLEVRKKCGDPDFVSQRVEKRKEKYKVSRWIVDRIEEISEERVIEILVDEWAYDLGPERFVRYVDFENNRLVHVRTGSYGAKK